MLIEQERLDMQRKLDLAEAARRDRPTCRAVVLPDTMDYATSGNVMELAMGHLRESVPNGQKTRTQMAWLALKAAMRHQEEYLRKAGYIE